MSSAELTALIEEARVYAATLDAGCLFTPGCGVVRNSPGSFKAGEIVVAAKNTTGCDWLAWFPATGDAA